MTFSTVQIGAQSASVLRHPSANCAARHTKPKSLADLLLIVNSNQTSQLPMLRTTAGKIAAFLDKPIDEISLDLIYANREGFRPFLESLRYKEPSVRSYVNYLRMLLQAAETAGWQPFAHLPAEWQPVIDLARHNQCLALVKFIAEG